MSYLEEYWRIAIAAAVLLGLGLLVGQPLLLLFLGTAGYLVWHLVNVSRLNRWLNQGKRFHPPESRGIWDEIFQQIYRLQQRNRKRKRKLGKMLNRFQQATKALPDATVVLRAGGEEVEWWNAAAGALLGLRAPKDVGQRISNLVRHPDFVAYLHAGDYDEPTTIPSPVDDDLLLHLRIVPYAKNRRLLVARDITRLQQLEKIRRDFVANASHELRTPLTVVAGYLEAMHDDRETFGGDWHRTLDVMQEQTRRMQQLVEDLMLLSRLESDGDQPRHEPVDVPAMLAGIREDAVTLSGGEGHDIRLEILGEDLWLLGSETELRSAFSNLVYNAVRYTPAGGRIVLQWYRDKTGPHFAVTDTGIGIPAQHIPRLTERFYRVDVGRSRSSGGTGLGLAIVKHVLHRHGASLRIDSVPGRGSCFTCDFPIERISGRSRCA